MVPFSKISNTYLVIKSFFFLNEKKRITIFSVTVFSISNANRYFWFDKAKNVQKYSSYQVLVGRSYSKITCWDKPLTKWILNYDAINCAGGFYDLEMDVKMVGLGLDCK